MTIVNRWEAYKKQDMVCEWMEYLQVYAFIF